MARLEEMFHVKHIYLESVYELPSSQKVVIPAKAGIQSFQRSRMPDQVRHDGLRDFMGRHYLG